MRLRRFVVLPLVFAWLCPALTPARASTVPLDYRAYDGWNVIRTPRLSDDGRWLVYVAAPQDGDPTLVARDLTTAKEWRVARGSAPAFAGDGSAIVATLLAPKKDVDAARKAGKTGDDLPKSGAVILDLASGKTTEIARVRTIVVPRDAGHWIALRHEPAPSASSSPAVHPSAAPSASPTPRPTGEPSPQVAVAAASPSASPSPTPSASPSPAAKADKKKDTGAQLELRDVVAGTRVTVEDVTDVAIGDDGATVGYATESRDGKNDGVHVRRTADGATFDVLTGAGRYRKLAIAHDGGTLAFLSDTATYAVDVPHDALYVVDLRAATPVARRAVDGGSPHVPPGWAPSADGNVTISRDGARVFVGAAATPSPIPSPLPSVMKVDIWSYRDSDLQSSQRHDADRERKRTYLGVYDLAHDRYAQLATPQMRDVTVNRNAQMALGVDDRPYRRAASWLGNTYGDAYAVSLADGTRKLAIRHSAGAALSPGGRYLLDWDERTRHWFAVRTSDLHRVVLAPEVHHAFWDEDDDHPAPPSPYGSGGWLAGDRGVFLYDRYDVWLVDPDTGRARAFTDGAGRREQRIYSPLQTDPDAEAFPADRPVLLGFIDERSNATGYARVGAAGGTPVTLVRVDKLLQSQYALGSGMHYRVGAPVVAKRSARAVFSEESIREFRDLWATDGRFSDAVKVTNANPQQAQYRWATERLLTYRAKDGTPLRAVELLPDGFDPHKKYPMLVYFYERWSDRYHAYYTPAPGTSPNLIRYPSNGYVMLLPDVRYRSGHPGQSAVKCLDAALDAAIAHGGIDTARIGIAGHSWAAYQINYLLGHSHRFRAAEAGAAVDDMFSAYAGIRLESGNVRESQYEHGQSRIGATPWDRPDLYMENSGIFSIRNITTPYLTIHNDLDGAVPQFQGIEFITAMRRLGKTAYLFSFDGEDHNLRGREEQKWWTVHLDEWFDHYLKGAPRPAWFEGVPFIRRGERSVRPLYGEPE